MVSTTATVALMVLGGAFAGGLAPASRAAPAATLVAICSVLAQVQTLPTIWHAIDRGRVWPMVVTGRLGVPIGARLLAHLNPGAFRLSMGVLLLGYSGFMLLGRVHRAQISWGGRAADGAVGFAGGILGDLAGPSGPLPTMWATLRGWGKDERRAVFQVYNLSVLAGTIVLHAASGLMTAELGRLALVALPGTLAGAWLGSRVYLRLSDQHFHEVVLTLLGVSGLTLVWTSF